MNPYSNTPYRRPNFKIFAGVLIIALGASVFLRYSAIEVGFIYYDDFLHAPIHHLKLYRFIQATELYLMSEIMGDDYIISIYPKIVAFFYLTLNAVLIFITINRWKIPVILSSILVVFYLFHPIVSDYVLWNSLTPAHLGVSLAILAFLSLISPHKYRLPLTSVLIFLSVGAYPPCVGIFLTLLMFEALATRAAGPGEWRNLVEGFGCILVGGLLFLAYKASQDHLLAERLENVPRSRRLVSIYDLHDSEFWRRKKMEISNQYINTMLPLFSGSLDTLIAGKVAVRALVILFLVPLSLIVFAGRTLSKITVMSALFVAGFLSPLGFNFLVNASSLGIRVSIAPLLAVLFSLAVAARLAQNTRLFKPANWTVGIVAIALIALSASSTHLDARIRAEGWRATIDALSELATTKGRNAVVPLQNPDGATESSYRASSYLISYQRQSCREYGASSYFHTLTYEGSRSPAKFLDLDRFTGPEISLLQARCLEAAGKQRCGPSVADASEEGLYALCVFLPP